MVQKFLTQGDEDIEEVEPIVSSAGAADAGKIAALDPDGKWDESLMPNGVAANTLTAPASENLTGGNLVNIWNDSGTWKVRKADNSNGRKCRGFVKASVTAPANATVYFDGTVTGLSSLDPDKEYHLGTSGGTQDTAPTSSGNIAQKVGYAKSATELVFCLGPAVVRA